MEVADGCDHKKELADEYLGLCKQWIEYASRVSSVEINGLLQSYLLNIHIPTPGSLRFIGTGVTSQFGDMFGSKCKLNNNIYSMMFNIYDNNIIIFISYNNDNNKR